MNLQHGCHDTIFKVRMMKKNIYLLIIPVFLAAACQNTSKQSAAAGTGETAEAGGTVEAADTASAAKFEFAETSFDFGTVEAGEKVSHAYSFTNTGSSSLIISNAQASCGCTVPEWTKEPIAPGETGEIQVVFNSQGRSGKQNKTITVHANTNPSVAQLYLTGEVKAKAE